MKLVYIITRADAVGGASVHVRDLACAMRDRGHEVTVLIGGRGPVTDQLTAAGVAWQALRWLRRSVNPWYDLLALAELRRVLRRLRPDMVSAHTAKAGFVGRAACRWLKIPVVYTPHGWPSGERMPRISRAVFGWMERIAEGWSDAIICVCEDERRVAIQQGIGSPGRFTVVPNGVRDVNPGCRADPERAPVRICSVARFATPKDHSTLMYALAKLKDIEWQAELIGEGPEEGRIRRLVADLGLADRIRFNGYISDPAPTLAAAQVFVLSSHAEAFPRSILEAFRAGLPVVATNVGGVGEAVEHGINGLLVAPNDTNSLAAALRSLLINKGLRAKLGEAARASFEHSYRVETLTGRTEAVYATVQVRTARPRRPV